MSRKIPLPMIAIEGIDGSGKTLQANQLKIRLEKNGKRVKEISFPQYGRFFGKEIGHYLSGESIRADQVDSKSMSLWYAMDRWDAFQHIDYSGYDILLMNRYVMSNAVYQAIRSIDQEDNWAWIKELEHTQLGLPEPDLYILLDVAPDCAQKNVDRKGERNYVKGRDVYEAQEGLLLRARARYLDIAKREDNVEIIACMDEQQRQYRPEQIAEQVWRAVESRGWS